MVRRAVCMSMSSGGSCGVGRSAPAHLADNRAHCGALCGVELGHQVVCWVADNRAEDSGNVAGRKGHSELLCLCALRLGLGDHVLVQRLHCVLKAGCMHKSHVSQAMGAGRISRSTCCMIEVVARKP